MTKNNVFEKLELIGIKLKNYRSYNNFPDKDNYLEIMKFTTLIGKNDVGKSNLLKAIDIVCENKEISVDDLHKGNKKNCEISLFFKVPESIKEGILGLLDSSDGNLHEEVEIKKIFEWDKDKNKLKRGYYFLNNKKINYKKLEKYLPYTVFVPAVKDLESELKFGKDTAISRLFFPIIERTSEEKSRSESVSVLKDKLRKAIKKETENIRKTLKEELSKMWEDVEEIVIDIPELKLNKAFNPEIKIKDKYLRRELPITYRGNGIQRYFLLALLEIYRKLKIGKGCLLLFEEPEIYLHVGAQKKMCNVLKEISNEGEGTVIISTHSNIFVDKSDISATYLLVKENGETKVRKFKGNAKVLEELGISPSDIFLTDGIILVEGPSDVEIVNTFARALFSDWDESNIAIIPIGGSNIEHLEPEVLLQVNPHIFVILDSDVKSPSTGLPHHKKVLEKKFENANIKVYFWKKDDGGYVRTIENLFTREAIEKALGITLDREISPYEDVAYLLSEKLFEKIKKDSNLTNQNREISMEELRKRGKLYNKIKHGKKIAKKMAEMGIIPKSVREILKSIKDAVSQSAN